MDIDDFLYRRMASCMRGPSKAWTLLLLLLTFHVIVGLTPVVVETMLSLNDHTEKMCSLHPNIVESRSILADHVPSRSFDDAALLLDSSLKFLKRSAGGGWWKLVALVRRNLIQEINMLADRERTWCSTWLVVGSRKVANPEISLLYDLTETIQMLVRFPPAFPVWRVCLMSWRKSQLSGGRGISRMKSNGIFTGLNEAEERLLLSKYS